MVARRCGKTVYTTDQGSYYHYKPNCSDMMGSKAISIEDALTARKPACPTFIGGSNAPDEEDILKGEFRFSDKLYLAILI